MNIIPHYAVGATGTATWLQEETDKYHRIINTQLKYWLSAVEQYQTLPVEGPLPFDQVQPILNNLVLSLTNLFGMHYPKKEAPQLLGYLKYKLPEMNGLKISEDHPETYAILLELDDFQKDVGKHLTIAKINKAEQIDRPMLVKFMKATQETWVWFMQGLGIRIPDESLPHFSIF